MFLYNEKCENTVAWISVILLCLEYWNVNLPQSAGETTEYWHSCCRVQLSGWVLAALRQLIYCQKRVNSTGSKIFHNVRCYASCSLFYVHAVQSTFVRQE